ncbi:MAG: riboflavin biosynthesis protein RibF [Candidatus Azobacteroides sp.]|nr:riboflavin biosynthesis protein RibF [Candidatus Azobacteroides sp.]
MNQPSVATIGFFDGVHIGHRFLIDRLNRIAGQKGLPSMIITFPVHPRKILHDAYVPQLLTTFEEKMQHLAETEPDVLYPLEFTHTMSQLSAEAFIKQILIDQLKVNTLLIGYDHRFGKGRTEGFDDYAVYGKKYGMEVVQADAYTFEGMQISSSYIRGLLRQGDIRQANKLLTYRYRLEGTVVGGRQIGRSIGFPTANIQPGDKEKILPAIGVCAVYVWIDGIRYKGMLNIGYSPTVSTDYRLTVEVHLIDFEQDIYGKPVILEFVDYIRSELKYNSLDELKQQLILDRENAIKKLTLDSHP